ncbi:class I SAM-dependent methyltransferase [Frankia sp. AgB1.9]|uniref:class I SAM-dependent methyltransferase n=1 Tax=unclassified Frankia TaxID=2632575 RepID=UPI001933C0D7|nr:MULTISPECIES: class I SAM-dependent methyltransferase [unclassified Frankia]MBL7489494.1 class I SAM-dependent methyltransferase [Frankia sp. AgW1.1]MBL7547776.1 class I SAM-dependent methyltransferase [Frankia sp. AgB1.9]MBL7621268.1 class I SAM-dependent methyltransferase [Frankia sp. AgB1.8]
MPNSVNFDRMADRYDATRGGELRGSLVAEDVAPHLPKGRLLEIGVGTGLIAAAFANLGREIVGIDLSEKMLAHATRRVPGRVVRADASKLPVADGCVDACLAVHVMHLVGDAPAVVAEVARVLRPSGRFAVVGGGANVDLSDITEAMMGMQARLEHGALRERGAQVAALTTTAERAGLRLVEDLVSVHEVGQTTPAQAADGVEQRLWSRLWDLSAETWAEVVEPTIALLRRLPDQDRPRSSVLRSPVQIFEAPAG